VEGASAGAGGRDGSSSSGSAAAAAATALPDMGRLERVTLAAREGRWADVVVPLSAAATPNSAAAVGAKVEGACVAKQGQGLGRQQETR
jgi:hypothetical protein